MQSIELTKDEYVFLRAGRSKNGGAIGLFMSDGEGMVLTTNGYSIHAIRKQKEYDRGYYLWSENDQTLMKIDGDGMGPGKDILSSALKVRSDYIEKMKDTEALDVVTFNASGMSDGLYINKITGDGVVGFRKGTIKNRQRSICLGTNFAHVQWTDDGETRELDVEKCISIDIHLLLSVSKFLPTAKMLWVDRKSPAIFGDVEAAHSVIMPMYLRGLSW